MTNEENKKEETEVKEEVKETEEKKEEVKEEVKEEKKEEVKEEVKEEKKEEVKEEVKEEKKEVEVPSKFKNLVKEIEEMTVLDLAELVKLLEEKFGVSAAPQVIAGAPAGAAQEGAAEAKSTFSIVLTAVGDKKIQVIKAIRDITKKGLKESKDLADAIASEPQVIKENAKKEEADEIKKLFEEAGAKVELK